MGEATNLGEHACFNSPEWGGGSSHVKPEPHQIGLLLFQALLSCMSATNEYQLASPSWIFVLVVVSVVVVVLVVLVQTVSGASFFQHRVYVHMDGGLIGKSRCRVTTE